MSNQSNPQSPLAHSLPPLPVMKEFVYRTPKYWNMYPYHSNIDAMFVMDDMKIRLIEETIGFFGYGLQIPPGGFQFKKLDVDSNIFDFIKSQPVGFVLPYIDDIMHDYFLRVNDYIDFEELDDFVQILFRRYNPEQFKKIYNQQFNKDS